MEHCIHDPIGIITYIEVDLDERSTEVRVGECVLCGRWYEVSRAELEEARH